MLIFVVCLIGVNPQLDSTWKAICQVESANNPHAVNLRENAVGIAQIRPIYLRDANRIAGYAKWKLSDRLDPVKSREMFETVVLHYCPHGAPQDWARIHNGGPRGPSLPSTLDYWRKILAAMNR